MNLGLRGRNDIISDAALKQFVAEGCDVAFLARSRQGRRARAELAGDGTKVIGKAFDMSVCHQAYRDWLPKAAADLGGCDILIHNCMLGAIATGARVVICGCFSFPFSSSSSFNRRSTPTPSPPYTCFQR